MGRLNSTLTKLGVMIQKNGERRAGKEAYEYCSEYGVSIQYCSWQTEVAGSLDLSDPEQNAQVLEMLDRGRNRLYVDIHLAAFELYYVEPDCSERLASFERADPIAECHRAAREFWNDGFTDLDPRHEDYVDVSEGNITAVSEDRGYLYSCSIPMSQELLDEATLVVQFLNGPRHPESPSDVPYLIRSNAENLVKTDVLHVVDHIAAQIIDGAVDIPGVGYNPESKRFFVEGSR